MKKPRGTQRYGQHSEKTKRNGAYVSPGQTLLTIVPTHDIWVTANYKETQLRDVKPGDRVEIEVDETGKIFTGLVDSVANATGSRLSLLAPEKSSHAASLADAKTAREQMVQLVVNQYLLCLRLESTAKLEDVQVTLAQKLFDQASHLEEAGAGAGLDTLRARQNSDAAISADRRSRGGPDRSV